MNTYDEVIIELTEFIIKSGINISKIKEIRLPPKQFDIVNGECFVNHYALEFWKIPVHKNINNDKIELIME